LTIPLSLLFPGIRDVRCDWQNDISKWMRHSTPGRNTAFLGGYLEAIRRRSSEEFTSLVQVIVADPELKKLLPEVVSRTGGVTETMDLITQLLERAEIPVETLSNLRYIHKVSEIPEPTFSRWMELLRKNGDPGQLGLAPDFLYARYKHESAGPLPVQMVAEFLAESLVIKMATESRTDRHNHDYHWGKLLELLTANDQSLAVSVATCFSTVFRIVLSSILRCLVQGTDVNR